MRFAFYYIYPVNFLMRLTHREYGYRAPKAVYAYSARGITGTRYSLPFFFSWTRLTSVSAALGDRLLSYLPRFAEAALIRGRHFVRNPPRYFVSQRALSCRYTTVFAALRPLSAS